MASVSRSLRGDQWADHLSGALAGSSADTPSWVARHVRPLKTDRFSRAGLLELQGQSCFLKLYLAKSSLQRLGFRLGHGRAVHSFDAAHRLASAGLPVPSPLACLLVEEGMILLTEGIAHGRDLRALWLEQAGTAVAEQLMRAAGGTLAALHRAGFAHGDCKWSNLLWDETQLYLVDLESVRAVKSPRDRPLPLHARQLADLARYTVDAEELGATPARYAAFMDDYCSILGCRRELVSAGMLPALEAIRKRHRETYGSDYPPLVR
ncbi:MAG: lipopolysaccharide kinase InaA family protein [Halieaceae bacterium]|jgi:tRNA A-37 threonylcarbamoyl transferase component Bud32|nr:lipopolysaccharide kinase InaA family protein [Halieaceae bacterium]